MSDLKNLQRLKSSQILRDLCSETTFGVANLIQPLFVVEGLGSKEELPGLRGNFRETQSSVIQQIENDLEAGVRNFILFNVPQNKAASDFNLEFAQNVIRNITQKFGQDLHLWVDTCLCSHTESGHCCLFADKNKIDLEATLAELKKMALGYAQAGAQGIAPSDMMDERTAHLRKALSQAGFEHLPLMSYSTKFSSQFYGPFRHAAQSSPQFGDRRQYQLDVRDGSQALLASQRCAEEGADLLMVKPGMTSIDLIRPIHEATGLKVGAYQVSGEFASIDLLARENLVDFEKALWESWHVFKRAGAQYIITYGARQARSILV